MFNKQTIQILKLYYKRRYFIIIATLTFGILAFVFTLFATPKYASEAIVYPPAVYSAEQVLEKPGFGYEVQANRLIQILRSSRIRSHIVNKFNLLAYFQIDTTQRTWRHQLINKINKMVSYTRTPYSSVAIKAVSNSPQLSAEIANFLAEDVNRVQENLIKNNLWTVLQTAKNNYFNNAVAVKNIIDSIIQLKSLTKNRVLKNINQQIKSTSIRVGKIENKLKKLNKKHGISGFSSQLTQYAMQYRLTDADMHYNKKQFELLKTVLPKNDTALLRLKGKILGSKYNRKTAEKKLDNLRNIYFNYSILQTKHTNEIQQLINLQNQYEILATSIEPQVQSTVLNRLQMQLEFRQKTLEKSQSYFERTKDLFNAPVPDAFIVSKALPDAKPVSPSMIKNILLGLIVGFVFSVGGVWLVYRWQALKNQIDAS